MARRDLTPLHPLDFTHQGGAATEALATDGLDAALSDGLSRLRQVAQRITRDRAAADDVVQNAALKALLHRRHFRGDAKPSSWLHRIVVNEALMWYRSERRRSARAARLAAFEFADPAPSAQPLDALLTCERGRRLARALRSLRPEDAELIAHCALEENGYAVWAREHRMRATAAKTRAFRARRALRAALEADEA